MARISVERYLGHVHIGNVWYKVFMLISSILALSLYNARNVAAVNVQTVVDTVAPSSYNEIKFVGSTVTLAHNGDQKSYMPVVLHKNSIKPMSPDNNNYHLEVTSDEKGRVKVNGVSYKKAKNKMSRELINMVENVIKEEHDLLAEAVYSENKDGIITYTVEINKSVTAGVMSAYNVMRQLSIKANGLNLTNNEKQKLYVQEDENGNIERAYYTPPKEESFVRYLSNGQDVDFGDEETESQEEEGDNNSSSDVSYEDKNGTESSDDFIDFDEQQEQVDNAIKEAFAEQEADYYYKFVFITGTSVLILLFIGVLAKSIIGRFKNKAPTDYGIGPYSPLHKNSLEKSDDADIKTVGLDHEVVFNPHNSAASDECRNNDSFKTDKTLKSENSNSTPDSATTMVKVLTNE